MKNKTFTRAELADILVNGLGRATNAHSAGEIRDTLAALGVNFLRSVVHDLLDELVRDGRIASSPTTFFRNGGPRKGRAYHSNRLLKEIRDHGPKDHFDGLTKFRANFCGTEKPTKSRLVELAEELARRKSHLPERVLDEKAHEEPEDCA